MWAAELTQLFNVTLCCVGENSSSSSSSSDEDEDKPDDDVAVVTKVTSKPRAKPSHRSPPTTAPGNVMHIPRALSLVNEQGRSVEGLYLHLHDDLSSCN